MSLDVIILAGGFGTRLRSVVSGIPKSLAPIRGKPFLDFLLESLEKKEPITRVILALGFQSEVIQNYYRTHSFRFPIEYSIEKNPLGTGGASRLALEKTHSRDILILNGDSFLKFDLDAFVNFHQSRSAVASLLLAKVDDASRYGSVILNPQTNQVISFQEKSGGAAGFVNAGVYLISRFSLSQWALNQTVSIEKEVLPSLIPKGLYGMISEHPLMDIGTPDSYDKAQNFFRVPKD